MATAYIETTIPSSTMKPIDQPKSVVDEVITEVRRHKRAIMAEHGDDVEKLLQDIRQRQMGNPRLVVSLPPATCVRDEPAEPAR